MSSTAYPFPVALSRLGDEDSREPQNNRAIRWLAAQPDAPVVLITPRRSSGASLNRLLATPGVTHLTWRGLSSGALVGKRGCMHGRTGSISMTSGA